RRHPAPSLVASRPAAPSSAAVSGTSSSDDRPGQNTGGGLSPVLQPSKPLGVNGVWRHPNQNDPSGTSPCSAERAASQKARRNRQARRTRVRLLQTSVRSGAKVVGSPNPKASR